MVRSSAVCLKGLAQEAGAQVKRATGSDWTLKEVVSHLSPAVAKFSECVADRAQGSYVWTTDGRRHLDMACGIGTLSTGHCHPRVVAAIQHQAGRMIMAQQNIFPASLPMVELLHRFGEIMPDSLSRFFFCNCGSEAVDNAIKIARSHTGRQNIIAFEGGFHGRTFGAMALTTSKTVYRQTFGPQLSGIVTAPYPYCLHCPTRAAAGGLGYTVAPCTPPLGRPYEQRQCCNSPLDALKWMLKMQTAPQETAAIILEPVLGEGGFQTPPPGMLRALRDLCDEHGMLLIFDEVQAGMGRTGKWWSHQLLGDVQPDMMLFAKGIASGFPFAGIASRPELYDKMVPGMMGGTYGGSTLGCAAAVATIDIITEEHLLENAQQRGLQLARGMLDLAQRYPIVDVRGRGLMVAAEFGGRDGGLSAEPGVAARVTRAASKHGMLLLTAGARESIRMLPPLNVSSTEIDEALQKLELSLRDVFGSQAAA